MSGVSMKRTASSTERWFGSFFSSRGVLTSFAGLASTTPSRMRNWKKVLREASLRAIEVFFLFWLCSSESHSRIVMWSISFTSGSRRAPVSGSAGARYSRNCARSMA